MMRACVALLCAFAALPAAAQTIFKCIDANGGTLISNTRVDKNCKAMISNTESFAPPTPARPTARPAGASANPSPAGFPRVQEETQRARDGDRRHILEQELSGEQRNLDIARRELAEHEASRAPGGAERAAQAREKVGQHERNIKAIQKELSNLK